MKVFHTKAFWGRKGDKLCSSKNRGSRRDWKRKERCRGKAALGKPSGSGLSGGGRQKPFFRGKNGRGKKREAESKRGELIGEGD